MKQKGDTKTQQQVAGTTTTGTRTDQPDRKQELEAEIERKNKTERHWTKRLAKRTFHPDGPGGGYEGL